jgi:hypothetical protein
MLRSVNIENVIDGRPLWTRCLKTPIGKVCRDLKVEGFRVDLGGLISDLDGKPELRFALDGTVEVLRQQKRA